MKRANPLVLTQIQPLATALHLEPLHADDWAIAGIGSLLVGILPLLFDYVRSIRHHAGEGGHAEDAHGTA